VTVLDHRPYSPDLAPADYFFVLKSEIPIEGASLWIDFGHPEAVTSTLNTTAKDDFYIGIQKLYDRANLCVQLQRMYVEN